MIFYSSVTEILYCNVFEYLSLSYEGALQHFIFLLYLMSLKDFLLKVQQVTTISVQEQCTKYSVPFNRDFLE